MWVSKLTLRIFSTIFDLALIGTSASLGVGWAATAVIFFMPPAVVSFVWNVSEGISLLVRGGHRGIHPGACVGVDLILWMGFCTTSLLYLLFGYGWYYYYDEDIFSNVSSESSYHTHNRACIAFGFLETIMHFALFVIACVETSKRNQGAAVIVCQPPPGMVLVPQGQYTQSMYNPPDQYNKHQSMVIPATYQPAPQGYQAPVMHPQPGPQVNGGFGKPEADSTPLSAPSPVYDGHTERR